MPYVRATKVKAPEYCGMFRSNSSIVTLRSEATQHCPEHSITVSGCNRSTLDRSGWLKLWGEVFHRDHNGQTCIERDCPFLGDCGGHLWVGTKEDDVEHCYIAPVCRKHNSVKYNWPDTFQTKPGALLVKIPTHAAVVQWVDEVEPVHYIQHEGQQAKSSSSHSDVPLGMFLIPILAGPIAFGLSMVLQGLRKKASRK